MEIDMMGLGIPEVAEQVVSSLRREQEITVLCSRSEQTVDLRVAVEGSLSGEERGKLDRKLYEDGDGWYVTFFLSEPPHGPVSHR